MRRRKAGTPRWAAAPRYEISPRGAACSTTATPTGGPGSGRPCSRIEVFVALTTQGRTGKKGVGAAFGWCESTNLGVNVLTPNRCLVYFSHVGGWGHTPLETAGLSATTTIGSCTKAGGM